MARQLDLRQLKYILQHRGYIVTQRKRSEDYLHVQSPFSSGGEVFFFKDGTFVCWNMAQHVSDEAEPGQLQQQQQQQQLHEASSFSTRRPPEEKCLLEDAAVASSDRFEQDMVDSEEMNVVYEEDGRRLTGMSGEDIVLRVHEECPHEAHYAKLAFSHGLARSTQLGVLEKHLSKYLESIEDIPVHMMRGRKPPLSAKQIMQKHGQLLYIRGLLNLHTELVDSYPEFYWTRTELAKYFESISRTLDVIPRYVSCRRLGSLVTVLSDCDTDKTGSKCLTNASTTPIGSWTG